MRMTLASGGYRSGMGGPSATGVHLTPGAANAAEIDGLAALLGGRVGLGGVVADLNRRGRRGLAPGRAVRRSLTWDPADRRDRRWWPQGISTSADASETEGVDGRRLIVTTWYAKDGQGSRVSVLDLETRRYRHVLLVVPVLRDGLLTLEPLEVHAGGLVWSGPYLYVAATGRGIVACRVDDLMRVPDELAGASDRLGIEGGRVATYGYRYLLPVRFAYRAATDEGHDRLRYSFLSLDRATSPPQLVVGEYGSDRQTRRLARFAVDPGSMLLAADEDGLCRPVVEDGGVVRAQGAALAAGRWYLTASRGPWLPGSVHVGGPGAFRAHRLATPMGPEDLAYWPSTDELWSLSEHPRRRWVFAMPRSWFDR